MQFHNIKSKTNFRKSRRVGRGGKRGTFSGRGTKGQRSRAGAKIRPAERDILKRIPKLRGYKFRVFRIKPQVVNLDDINEKFKDGDTVSPESMHRRGLVRKAGGTLPLIKILGRGNINKKLIFKNVTFSKSAVQKTSPQNASK